MTTLSDCAASVHTFLVLVPDSSFLAWTLKISIRKSIARCFLSVDREMFDSALQMSSSARRSASVAVIVGWVIYLCF